MSTKLKIDLTQGVLEVEGSETFVKNIYNDFKTHFIPNTESIPETKPPTTRTRRNQTKTQLSSKKATKNDPITDVESDKEPATDYVADSAIESVTEVVTANELDTPESANYKPSRGKSPYKLLTDIDLMATQDRSSLIEFTDAKLPITNEERNLVFVYYLQEILELDVVTSNHIFTCYKEVHIRVPINIENSLQITANQHKWITIFPDGRLRITREGRKYVEHKLPMKKENR
jgi:hypothetical protein